MKKGKWVLLVFVLTGPVFNLMSWNLTVGYVISIVSLTGLLLWDLLGKRSK
ncbi:hypothetical protein [Jeotgalibacillus proteolyticus]|uniref:hypothetical protein n=1 Tax=Jeotgalibacillus proteolyticus TaxID=2082395 RepID=UPI0014304D50|nr:hypothetical protein [Jeotgalibacillus proteolyticus]